MREKSDLLVIWWNDKSERAQRYAEEITEPIKEIN